MKIPTLYKSREELLLDINIFGKIAAVPQRSINEMRDTLFEEFKQFKPFPSLEHDRYKLSRLVSNDYRVKYNNDVILGTNDSVVDLSVSQEELKRVHFDNLEPLIPKMQQLFSYENQVTESYRDRLLAKYNLETGEDLEVDTDSIEDTFGTVMENTSEVLSDGQIDSFLSNLTGQNIKEESSTNITAEGFKELLGGSPVEEPMLCDDIEYEVENPHTVENTSTATASDEDEEIDFDSYDDVEEVEEPEQIEQQVIDQSTQSEDVDDYDDDEDVEFDSYEDETEDSEDVDEFDSYAEDIDDRTVQEVEKSNAVASKSTSKQFDVAEYITDEVKVEDFIPQQEQPKIQPVVQQSTTGSEFTNNEPRDLRQFLRLHPHCEVSIVLKYFSKKEVEKELILGRILKKGNTLRAR